MATFKACVTYRKADGTYAVYIRVCQLKKVTYIKTSFLVDDRGLTKKKEIKDNYVLEQVTSQINEYRRLLNTQNTTNWDVDRVVQFLKNGSCELSFTKFAEDYIWKLRDDNHDRSAKNYQLALQHLQIFMCRTDIIFDDLTPTQIRRWIDSLSNTARAKEMYPVCMRQIWKAAMDYYNDPDKNIVRIQSIWNSVKIPKSDVPEKRAIEATMLRKFFGYTPDDSRFKHPLQELGQDVAKMCICLCGINSVDLFCMEKKDYYDGILHYKRCKTRNARTDGAYFEVKVPELLKPTFDKYLNRKNTGWLFDFHDRWANSDSFNANVNAGIRQICHAISDDFTASLYCFRHSWATIAQNNCGASLAEVDFGLNHSINKMAKVYTKIDYSPAWKLNEKVIDFIFFTDEEIAKKEEEEKSFEKIRKTNMIHAVAFVQGHKIADIQDIGFHNVEEVIQRVFKNIEGLPERQKVQIKITNVDKDLTQMYEREVK